MNTEDTWSWEGLIGPVCLQEHRCHTSLYTSCAYDPLLHQLVVFGGNEVSGAENATWSWTDNDWVQLHPLHSPSVRDLMGMAYDLSKRELIMFGG